MKTMKRKVMATKMVKLLIEATYANRSRFNNKVQKIIDLPVTFNQEDIRIKIPDLYYADSFTINKIEIILQYEDN
jgi:hypothetical protein